MLKVIKHSYGGYLIITPSKKLYIWDTGLNRRTVQWLIPYALKYIQPVETNIIISHWHDDSHTQGLPSLINKYKRLNLTKIYTSGVYSNQRPDDLKTKDESLELLDRIGMAENYVKAGDIIEDSDLLIEVLAPSANIDGDIVIPGNYTDNPNSVGSVVARFEYGNSSVLMTGDRDTAMLTPALSGAREPQSTILQAPHHGLRNDINQEIVDMVNPELVVMSHHPSAGDTQQWLSDQNIDSIRVGPGCKNPVSISVSADGTFGFEEIYSFVPFPRMRV